MDWTLPGHPTHVFLILSSLLSASPSEAQAQQKVDGTWQGEYTCAQGQTGLTLTITPSADVGEATAIRVKGLFHFYAATRNPTVPEGCFEMSGAVDPVRKDVKFTATRWLLQPPGYVMVDLAGTMSPGGTMTGTVFGPFCTGFQLHRVSLPDVRASTACQADAIASAR